MNILGIELGERAPGTCCPGHTCNTGKWTFRIFLDTIYFGRCQSCGKECRGCHVRTWPRPVRTYNHPWHKPGAWPTIS